MGWTRRVGRSLVAASLLVAVGVAANQLLSGDGRLSWTAAYFVLIFTVLGVLLNVLPERGAERKVSTSRHRYLRRMRASVEQMETIGLVTQAEYVLRTRQVYVDVVLQPRPVTETVPDGGVGGVSAPPAGVPGVRQPLSSFLVPGKVLAVLGAAGSGKTTLVRYTALTMAEQRWWPWQAEFWRPRRIPVVLYLRDHAPAILDNPRQNLAVIASAAPWLEGAVSERWLERWLERCRCVVLLDGLDEVADARQRAAVVEWVNTQVKRYPGNTIVLTSRPPGYTANQVAQADVLQVQRFTNEQIEKFLRAWFNAIEHRARQGDQAEIDRVAARGADDLIQRITALPALLDLAANPLLLTMIANVHRYRGTLPGSRADLYAEMCQVLLHRRQEVRNIPVTHPGLDDLSGEAKERLMRRLAWKMMLNHRHDIPITEAETALGTLPPQRQPGPPLTPQAFLDYARRSGLLLERRPGHYAFVHLSLQEYLAATHVPGDSRRRRALADQVSDSWWRETILLWAARNDASPVVRECLTARTVSALSLAYACAAQAAELDQELRDRLDQLLNRTPSDADEVRLLDSVVVDRHLRESALLEDGLTVCSTPVSQDLWNRYLRHLHGSDPPDSSTAGGSERARVRWGAELPGFLTWFNGLLNEGIAYRLPSRAELARLSARAISMQGTIWAYEKASGYCLYQPDGIPHPHAPTSAQLDAYSDLLIDHTSLLTHLATSTEFRLSSLLLYGSIATREGPPERQEHQLIRALDLLATIEAAHMLAFARDLALDRPRDFGLTREQDGLRGLASALDVARGRDFDYAYDFVIDRARSIAGDLQLSFDGDRDRDRDRARIFAYSCAFSLGSDLALPRDLDLHSTLTLVSDRDAYHSPASDRATTMVRNLDPDQARVLASDISLDRAFSQHHDLDPARDPSLALALARARDAALDLALDRAVPLNIRRSRDAAINETLPPAFGRSQDTARDRAIDRANELLAATESSGALAVARDLAVARLLQSDPRRQDIIWAGIGLLEAWTAYRPPDGEAKPRLRSFVSAALVDCVQAQPQDDPPAVLTGILVALRRGSEDSWVRRLLDQAQHLIEPVRRHDSQTDGDALVLAAALMLAAILAVTRSTQPREIDDTHLVLLQGALTTLIALTKPEHENQAVLLVRD